MIRTDHNKPPVLDNGAMEAYCASLLMDRCPDCGIAFKPYNQMLCDACESYHVFIESAFAPTDGAETH